MNWEENKSDSKWGSSDGDLESFTIEEYNLRWRAKNIELSRCAQQFIQAFCRSRMENDSDFLFLCGCGKVSFSLSGYLNCLGQVWLRWNASRTRRDSSRRERDKERERGVALRDRPRLREPEEKERKFNGCTIWCSLNCTDHRVRSISKFLKNDRSRLIYLNYYFKHPLKKSD